MKNKSHRILLVILVLVSFVLSLNAPSTVLSKSLATMTQGRNNNFGNQIFQINQDIEKATSESNAFSESRKKQIQSLLRQRAGVLRQTIRENPALALEAKLSKHLRKRLAKTISNKANLLESTGKWQGRLEKIARDDFESRKSDTLYYLTSEYGNYEVYFAGEAPPVNTLSDISVSGMLLGNTLAASDWSAEQDLPMAYETDFSCSAIGEQKIAIILVSMPSKQLPSTITAEKMNEAFFGTGISLNTFLEESSYGKTWATGDIVGPVLLDADYTYQPHAIRDAAVRAASGLIDFQNYNRIVLVVPQLSMDPRASGIGTIGCSQIYLDQSTPIIASVSWLSHEIMVSESSRISTVIHEMGHNLGLLHARAADFGDEALGPIGQLPAPFNDVREYGDCFSNMGSGGLGQWSAPHKYVLGWLEEGTDILSVETDGTFTIDPYEQTGGLKAVRVRRNDEDDAWLWLENRQAIGTFDLTLPPEAFNGALIHYEDDSWQSNLATNLLRFDFTGYFFDTAPLPSDNTWVDPYSRLTISVERLQIGGLQMSVAYSPPSVCPGSLSSTEFSFDSSGGTGTIDVAAPDECSWTVTPSVEWIEITSRDSGTGNGHITFSIPASGISSDRWGKITVGSDFVIIIQDGLAGEVTIYPDSAEIPAEGGIAEITVSTNTPDLEWSQSWTSHSEITPWIQNVDVSTGWTIGPATLYYTIGPNPTPEQRTGIINVGGNTFTITQAAGGPTTVEIAWKYLNTDNTPLMSRYYASAMFESRGELVLYGGDLVDGVMITDTWIWDGTNWQQVYPEHNPGQRFTHTMAYDKARDQVVLFGGYEVPRSGETWIWDGNDWHQEFPENSPPGRNHPAMAYDPVREKIVLFGGSETSYGGMNDTWEWDGSNWTQKFSYINPSPRRNASMAYDPERNEIVMFGGTYDNPVYSDGKWDYSAEAWFSDTWVWDGNEWLQKMTTASPSPREGAWMGYNPGIGNLFLFNGIGRGFKNPNGSTGMTTYFVDNWIWDGNDWHQVFSDDIAPPSYYFVAAYDPVHESFFAFADDMRCASRQTQTLKLEVLFLDLDNDGTLDSEDECPLDPDKIIPGICGCGVADSGIDIDTDEDGTVDCYDECPSDPDKIVQGICGCGVSDIDTDYDGTADCYDRCPSDPGEILPGICGCGVSSCRIIRLEWPKPIRISEVPIGAGLGMGFTIYNEGNMPLNVYNITCPTGFICPDNFSASIPPGEYVAAGIDFRPTEAMSYSGAVLVDSDKTAGENTITATGIGIPQTKIIRIGGDMNFGTVDVGQTATHPITIYNDGNYTLSLSNINCPDGFICPEDFDPNIWPSYYSSFDITFAPTTAGSYSGTILVESDKTDGTPWINVTGTGTGFLDTDNDGLPDDWEAIYGLDPLRDDSRDDADGDGFSNLREYLQGTIPNDPLSYPQRAMPWLPLLLE